MPELNNQTPYKVQLIPMIDKDGRNVAVVIAKGTYELTNEGLLKIAHEQEEIAYVDVLTEDPDNSNIKIPSDLIDYKPATDLVIIQPENFPKNNTTMLGWKISIETGPIKKTVRIFKRWTPGPLRRDKKPRLRYAGTYDKNWLENRLPLLPEDFNSLHNQVAPHDQIAPSYLQGNELVRITNLYKEKDAKFNLPGFVIIVSGNIMHQYFTKLALLDTVLIWSDKPRITLVWRYAITCRQKIEEVHNVFVFLARLRTAQELFGMR